MTDRVLNSIVELYWPYVLDHHSKVRVKIVLLCHEQSA